MSDFLVYKIKRDDLVLLCLPKANVQRSEFLLSKVQR